MAGEKNRESSFHLPQMAGNFRLGIANGANSLWANDLRKVSVKENKGRLTYTLTDPLLGKGSVRVHVARLADSDGIILEVKGENLPEGVQLIWSFGGCCGKMLDNPIDSKIEPSYCKYNVFSVEGTAFSAYHGESMRLRIIHGITPPGSDIRLADAHRQETPLVLFGSGKKTDAPVLAASMQLNNNEKLYFCFYTQNKKADYNYFMLPTVNKL
ncbi:DUF4450 domain-containing protein [Bacteroides sp. 51]|nr:DUF4450 domain-containing protein [Bacteroides sp. 51]